MLLPSTQLCIDKVTFCPYIGHDWRIAVESFICAGNALFFRLRIVKRRHIYIHRYVSVFECGRFDLHFVEQIDIRLQDVTAQGIPDHIKPLTQGFR